MGKETIEPVDTIQEVINNKQGWINYDEYVSNAMWFKDNIAKTYVNQYKGNIVIIYNHKVVFNNKDPQKVREELQSYDQNKRNQSYTSYIDPFDG